MAKRLLLNILVDVLDDYVEGLSIENLKLGVLSGKIELNNLQLKRTGLDKLNLPISVTHGSLKKLKLKVPWTALESKPVRVIIDGLYLQAGPLDVSSLSPEQLRKMAFDVKRQRLKAAEDAVMTASQSPEGIQEKTQKASYIQQLTAKIVDNIEITLTNVHIRYEDSLTIPGTTLSAGITIASLSLVTTDFNWNEAFVARETKSKASAIHKLGKLENVGVYWNTKSNALDPLSALAWEAAMQNLIYVTSDSAQSPKKTPLKGVGNKMPTITLREGVADKSKFNDYRSLDYILAAPNSLHLKIVHTERPSEGEPKIDMAIESTSLVLNLDKVQYQQAIGISVVFSLLEKQKQIALLRPLRRPTRDPRGWWHYAYKLVTGRTVYTATKMDIMLRCVKVKRRYITLVKRFRHSVDAASAGGVGTASSSATAFSALDDAELRRIEETIPIQALLVFRQFAAYEMVTEQKREERELQKGKNILSTFGWASNNLGNSGPNSAGSIGKEKLIVKSVVPSSVSSWFKSNLKTSKRARQREPDNTSGTGSGPGSAVLNQKYSKTLDRVVEVEDDDEDDDDKLIALIQSRLDVDPIAADQFLFRLVLNGSAALRLTSEGRPVAVLELAMSSTTEMKADGLVVLFALDDFQLIDECTLDPLSRYLIVSPKDPPPARQSKRQPVPKGPTNPFLVPLVNQPTVTKRRTTACNDAPKLLFVMDSRHGKTVVRLTVRPMEATWNELCVGRLLGIFMAPDVTHTHNTPGAPPSSAPSSSSFSPLLAAGMTKFSIDSALPLAGEMEIVIEIDAPKIIVPDNCFRDNGCLLFDTGYLVIKGTIGETSLHMDISLSNVNVGMPLSVQDKYLVEGKSLYLIKPLDVMVSVQTIAAVADVAVAVSVSPGIQAEFDAVKVARLIRHVSTIVNTMSEAVYPTDSGPVDMEIPAILIPTHMLRSFLPDASDANATTDRSIVTAAAQREGGSHLDVTHTPSPTHCWADVVVTLPLISVELLVSESHSVTFLVSGMETHVLVRQNDLQVYFALKTLRLIDSLRGQDKQAIIFTPPLTTAQKQHQKRHKQKRKQLLCTRKLGADPDPEIPDPPIPPVPYAPNEEGGNVHHFDREDLASESLISLTYTYMYSRQSPLFSAHGQEMSVEFSSLGLSIDEEAVLRLKPFLEMLAREMAVGVPSTPVPTTPAPQAGPVVAAVGPIGILVSVSIGSVSLSLMKAGKRSSADPRAFSPIALTHSLLEEAYTVEIIDMFAVIDMRQSMAADVRLRSFSVRDCRPLSRTYVYKDMICRSTLGSHHNSVAHSSIDRARHTQGPRTLQEEDFDILTVMYREESKEAGTVEVELRNITSFISVDGVIELVDVAMLNMAAMMAVCAALSGTAVAGDADADAQAFVDDERGRLTPSQSDADVRLNDSPLAWMAGGKTFSPPRLTVPGSSERRKSVTVPMVRQRSFRPVSSRMARGRTVSGASSSSSPSFRGMGKEHSQLPASAAAIAATPAFLMNVIVSVVSPRLLLLEDPESADSRAIVIRSGVSVHFCQDCKAGALSLETLHISLQTLEVFALTGLTHGRPQQIVEPTGVELHINRKLEAAVVLTTTVSLDVDTVSAKISVNDVVLANSILSRASIVNSKTDSRTPVSTARNRSSTTSSLTLVPVPSDPPFPSSLTVYDFVAQLGSISLVAINDFNGQNLPILRLCVDHSDFRAGGQAGDVQGEGSFQVSAEYYNTRVAVWEPLIERWGPRISVVANTGGTVVEAISDSTLQIDVSGAMVKTFSQVLNLTSTILEEFESQTPHTGPGLDRTGTLSPYSAHRRGSEKRKSLTVVRSMITDKSLARGSDSPVTFKNNLEFPVEVFDSVTHESLMVLRAGDSAPLLSPGSLSRSWIQSQGKYPTLFDVRVLGRLKDPRLPLLQLPLNVNKPRPYCLQPNLASGPGGLGGVKGSDRTRGTEPIMEESYENQRYHPLEMRWSNPWADLNDPPTWTDVLGVGPRNPSSVRLPSDRWEWIESDWKVDLSGVIGMEIDERGWEYATNFTSFSVSKKRRAKMPMDVTRRRRWIRSRIPKSTPSDELLRPLIIIWDVKAMKDGSRVAVVRSGLQVKNLMPFPLSVAIDGFPGQASSLAFHQLEEADQDSRSPSDETPCRAGTVGRPGGRSARIFDNIPEGVTFSLPLLLSAATVMRVKPSGRSYKWSKPMFCRPTNSNTEHHNGSTIKESEKEKDKTQSQGQGPGHFRIMAAPEGNLLSARDHHDLQCPAERGSDGVSSVCIQGMLLTADRSRLVACAPYAVCHNLLPSSLSYQFLGGDGNTEQGSLQAGSSGKLSCVNLTSRLLLSLQLEGYAWSAGILVDSFSEERQTLDLYPQGADGRARSGLGVGASVSMSVTVDRYRTAQIKIFSRFLLIDRTGLDVSVRTKRLVNKGNDSDFFSQYCTVERRTYARRRPTEGDGDVVCGDDNGDRRNYFPDTWDDGGWGDLTGSYGNFSPADERNDNWGGGGTGGGTRSGVGILGEGLTDACWTHGAHGITLFHSDPQDSKFSVGLNRGAVWSDPMSLLALGSTKVPFELVDKVTMCAYQLAHSTTQLPGSFKASQLVSVMPCYCVVNCLEEFLELRQVGAVVAESVTKEIAELSSLLFPSEPVDLTPSKKKCTVAAHSSQGWHRYDVSKGTCVQFRCESSAWSLCAVNLNEIGTTVLLVPKKRVLPSNHPTHNTNSAHNTHGTPSKHFNTESVLENAVEDALVLHVEVRFADPSDHSYVNIVVWTPVPDPEGLCHQSSLSIRNDTMHSVTVKQTGTNHIARAARADPSRYTIQVPPGAWKPYGWADQNYGSSVTITLDAPTVEWGYGSRTLDSTAPIAPYCEIDILKIGQSGVFHVSDGGENRGEILEKETIGLTVMAGAGGQVLHISTRPPQSSNMYHMKRPPPLVTDNKAHGRGKDPIQHHTQPPPQHPTQGDFTLILSLKSVGISLIAERPVRREFLSLYMDGIDGRMLRKICPHGSPRGGQGRGRGPLNRPPSVITSYELEMADMQVDNYSETAVFPVLMHSFNASHRERKKAARRRKREIRRIVSGQGGRSGKGLSERSAESSEAGAEDYPFLAISVVQELTRGSVTPIFKYVAVRILEIKLAVDSSTLQLYFCDLHGDLRGESREQAMASQLPAEWVAQFNHQMVSPGYSRVYGDIDDSNSGQLVDLEKTSKRAQGGRMYFETLIIHPMKLRLSFLPTPFPRSKHEDILSAEEYRGFKIVRAIAQVDELVVKISSFQIEDAMDSVATLGSRIMANTLRDLQNHLVTIVGRVFGSLEFIGKPAGLYRNVGEGVKEFFYEPYEGLMHSPEAFLTGLGKGTGGLMRGVMSGAITSTAAIVGSASKGVAKGVGAVSGDREFVRQREEKRRINTASSGGVLSGMKAGGESVFSGFTSGITGLVTRPFEEGKTGGALGFMKGVGLGMAGVVTKPILGVTDGLASLVHGISNQVSDAIVIRLARPPRAFDRSATDVGDKVLVPLDLASAHAQEFVLRAARRAGYSDSFISHISIDGSRHGSFEVADSNSNSTSDPSSSRSASASNRTNAIQSTKDIKKPSSTQPSAEITSAESGRVIANGSSVVVSEMFVYVIRKDGHSLGRFAFGEVSHCAFHSDSSGSSVELMLYETCHREAQAGGGGGTGGGGGGSLFDMPFTLSNSPHLMLFGDGTMLTQPSRKSRTQAPPLDTDPEVQTSVRLKCKSKGAAAKLYCALAVCAPQMGNPSSVLPPDVATAAPDQSSPALSSSSEDVQTEMRTCFQGYRFGSANKTKHTAVQCTEKDVLLRATRRFSEPMCAASSSEETAEQHRTGSLMFAKFLDDRVWQTVSEWCAVHQQLQSSRCLAVLLVNQSDSPVQILRIEVQEGRNAVTFGVEATSSSSNRGGPDPTRGYDEESRTLLGGGGAAVIFAFGFLPTLIDPAHVKVSIVTSAFNAVVSTRPNRTLCVAVGGYTAGYLEKSLTEYWAKYVILVS